MCKHIVNVQVQVKTDCCDKFFDCQFCHDVNEKHMYKQHVGSMTFKCKNCEKVFTKDMTDFEENDAFCPYCDNQFIVDPKFTDE